MKNTMNKKVFLRVSAMAFALVLGACTTTEPPFPYETKAEPCCGAKKDAPIKAIASDNKAVLAASTPAAEAQTVPAKPKKAQKPCPPKAAEKKVVDKKVVEKKDVEKKAAAPTVAASQPAKEAVPTVSAPVVNEPKTTTVAPKDETFAPALNLDAEKAKVKAEIDALKAEQEKLAAEKEKAKKQIAAKKCDEIKDWVASEGTTLRGLLTEWGNQAQWRVVWNMDRDYTLEAGAVFRGRFMDVSSALLRSFARARPAPKGTFYKGNKVLVISTREDENAE